MNFGKIDDLILFGGTQRMVNLIQIAKRRYRITVFSAARLLKQPLGDDKVTLEQHLKSDGIRYFVVNDINDFDIGRYINKNTLGISLGAPWIFRPSFINKFKGRLINGHGADLPRDRGAGGYSWRIMRGERRGCHLFHKVDFGIDSGSIIFSHKFLFPRSCRIPYDYERYFEKTEIPFLKDFFRKIASRNDFEEARQEERLSTYFPRLSTIHHGFINWDWSAREIERFICAFDRPYKGASTFLDGKRVYIRNANRTVRDGSFHPFIRGIIYRKTDTSFNVAAPDGSLVIREICDERKRNIFNKVKVGYRLATPRVFLDKAALFRAVYDAKGLSTGRK